MLLGFAGFVAQAAAAEYQQVIVADPYVDMRSGPGRGFPIVYVVEKGKPIKLIKKKTQWYKVESPRGVLGWVHEDQMARTLIGDGSNFQINKSTRSEFVERDYEAGVLAGDFAGANVLTLHIGWNWTPNITTELAVSQAVGEVASIELYNLSIMHQPFPEWLVSPYFKLGAGRIHTQPNATIIQAEDRSDEIINSGLGVRIYVSQHFFLRTEYNAYTILTSRNDNDKVEEWKIGLSIFF